jgi:23S rRNA pseudouridine2605 synthase
MPTERLQKIMAAAGIASRRKAEELITAGRVEVNGKRVTELGSKADPATDHIRVDGKLLRGSERSAYFILNKPKGYITAASDPEGRPTVLDLVRAGVRVYPVGRLDYASEGLLLLTNDGALAAKLMHASSHVPKTYQVKVSGRPTEAKLAKLRSGVVLPPDPRHPEASRKGARPTAPAGIRLLRDAPNPWFEVTLIEGRNRQIRRMFEAVDHHVEKIKRVRYGPLELDLEPGAFRPLTAAEVRKLHSAVSHKREMPPTRRRDTKELPR